MQDEPASLLAEVRMVVCAAEVLSVVVASARRWSARLPGNRRPALLAGRHQTRRRRPRRGPSRSAIATAAELAGIDQGEDLERGERRRPGRASEGLELHDRRARSNSSAKAPRVQPTARARSLARTELALRPHGDRSARARCPRVKHQHKQRERIGPRARDPALRDLHHDQPKDRKDARFHCTSFNGPSPRSTAAIAGAALLARPPGARVRPPPMIASARAQPRPRESSPSAAAAARRGRRARRSRRRLTGATTATVAFDRVAAVHHLLAVAGPVLSAIPSQSM